MRHAHYGALQVIEFVREAGSGKLIVSPQLMAMEVRDIARADQEVMVLLGLNTRNQLIFKEVVFKGGLTGISVDVKVIFRHLLLKNCAAFAVAHNHPAASCEPSLEDLRLTRRLRRAGNLVELRMLDHLIVTVDGFYAFSNNTFTPYPEDDDEC